MSICSEDAEIATKVIERYLPPKRKILFMLNPFSGGHRAPNQWEMAKEIFDKTNIEQVNQYYNYYDIHHNSVQVLVETEHAGFGYTYTNTTDLDEFDAIVTISGDGLIHEGTHYTLKFIEITKKPSKHI